MKKEALIPQSIKNKLPLPSTVLENKKFNSLFGYTDPNLLKAEKMIFDESIDYIKKIVSLKDSKYITEIQPEMITSARSLLLAEMAKITIDASHHSKFSQLWNRHHRMNNEYIRWDKTDSTYQSKIDKEYQNNERISLKTEKNIKKLREKIDIIYGGYAQRSEKLIGQINEYIQKNEQSDLEYHAFQVLRNQEIYSGKKRLADAQRNLDTVKKTEEHLQKVYTQLTRL